MSILFFNNLYPSKLYPKVSAYAASIVDLFEHLGYHVDVCARFASKNKIRSYLLFYFRLFTVSLNKHQLLYINHYTFLLPLVVRLMVLRKKRIIYHWHGEELVNDSLLFRFIRRCMRLSFNSYSYHISPSCYYKNVIIKKLGVSENSIFISPSGGVNLDMFLPKEHISDELHIGFPAALNKHKGLEFLYGLFEQREKIEKLVNKSVRFHIIRYGEDAQFVEKWVREHFVENIIIHDRYLRKDLFKFYAQTHITLFLSKRESLGLTVLESMACGIPVVARNNTSMPELIQSGVTGELLSQNPSIDEIINTIHRMYNGLSKYKARDFVEKYYDMRKVQKKLGDFVSQILE